MLIKLLIYIILGVVIYRVAKSWFGDNRPRKMTSADKMPLQADDVMLQDPQCGVYFARGHGVRLNFEGQELIFCSEACKQNYLAQRVKTH